MKCFNENYQSSNCHDSLGRKQGRWEFYRRFVYLIPNKYQLIGVENNTKEFLVEIQDDPIKKGYYKNDKPTGQWVFYYQSNSAYCWEQFNWSTHLVTYSEDSIIYQADFGQPKRIAFNHDSSFISGKIPAGKFITDQIVNFECRKQSQCYFWYKNQIIDSCKYEDYELYLYRIEDGEYLRVLKFIDHTMNNEIRSIP